MSIIKVIIPICLLVLLASCGEIDTLTSSSFIADIPSSSNSSASSLDNTEEGEYLNLSNSFTIERRSLVIACNGGLLNTPWTNSQELSPDALFEFYESLVILEQTEHLDGATVPADIVEAAVAQYLDITPSYMQTSKYYNPDQNAYTVRSLDEARDIVLDSVSKVDGIASIEYSIYLHHEKQSAGLLTVAFDGNNHFRYLSNVVQPQEYVGVDNISTTEQKALLVAFNGNLLNTSWTDTNELNPDFLFEFYESLVIFKETEHPPEGATVPGDIVEAAVARHLDITPSYMQTSSYYNRDDHSYTIGGLGQVRDIALDSVKVHDGITSIEYSIYLRHKKQGAGLLTVALDGNNNYRYLSNIVQVHKYLNWPNSNTIEQRALVVAFNGSLLNTSWADSHELSPDALFEFYESLVIFKETEHPPEGATVPADIVEAAVARHLDITPSYMQTSSYYNRDDNSYTVGGLGQVKTITLDSVTECDGITSIEYTMYFRDQAQRTGLLTAEFGDNNYYKYLSNKVQDVD